jgi:gamma-carbonic anhydrase
LLLGFDGKTPQLGSRVYLAPTAALIGDVHLADDVSVWFGAVVRGDGGQRIRVGARSNIQDLVMVHVTGDGQGTCIGEDVTVGHRAIVHACTVEDRCLIGMGAIVLDGAVIGEESIVGAGAVVPQGMHVPPRSLVLGTPARIRRTLGDDDVAHIMSFTHAYLDSKARYLEQGDPSNNAR